MGDEGRFQEAWFNEAAYFRDAEFQQFSFDKAVFRGTVNFRDSKVHSSLNASQAKFLKPTLFVPFDRLKVGGDAHFDNAQFEASVSFNGADIAGNFSFKEGTCKSTAIFDGMKVSNNASFDRTVFENYATFNYLNARILSMTNAKFKGRDDKSLKWAASFTSVKVEDNTTFEETVFNGKVWLINSKFGTIKLCSIVLQDNGTEKPLKLDGMTYQSIEALVQGDGQDKKCSKNSHDISRLLEMAEYSKSAYANLENFYRAQGDLEESETVFWAQKRRERKEMLKECSLSKIIAWLWDSFLALSVGYGHNPERVLLPCIAIISIGCFVFRRKDMVLRDGKQLTEEFSPLFYSLDLFLPFIDLYAAEIWIPRKELKGRLWYMRFHAMAGWILVPVGLAALTGFID